MLPFLKWAGGKRWLFTPEFVKALPEHSCYIEPFLGGGAGFFAMQPARSILADVNPDLIGTYRIVRDSPRELASALFQHQEKHSEHHYYAVRSAEPIDEIAKAARFLYLNRTCWNGLYRVNKAGRFNVPKGTKSAIILDSDNFERASELLKDAEIVISDFEEIIDRAKEGDLVFADPPYTVKHNMNGFVKYNEDIFAWADQVRLRDCIARAASRGARVVVTNADHGSLRELYEENFSIVSVSRASVISGSAKGRSSVTEILVTA